MARGKTSADPAELEKLEWPYDWPPPWRNDRLIGHDDAEKTMLAAHGSGRLHHAWLITGPRGIGKATLAWRFARFLLCGSQQGGLFGGGPESLDVGAGAPDRNRVDARTHTGLFHLRRSLHDRENRIRDEIAIKDVRELGTFMRNTENYRVAIIDSAEEMNRNSANAILKILEEPRPNSVLLMVSHAPGKLLPTILSRCRRLALQPLSHDIVVNLLGQYAPETSDEERRALAGLADGSIGRALELETAGSLGLYQEMVGVLATLPELDMARLHSFAERFSGRGEEANSNWRTLNYLFDKWFKALIRHAAIPEESLEIVPAEKGLKERLLEAASLDRWVEACERVARLLARSDAVNTDRKQTVLVSFLALQSAMR